MADAADNNFNDTSDASKPVTIISESLRRKRALNGGAAPAAIIPPQETPEAKAAAANLAAGLEYAAAGMAVFPATAAKIPLTPNGIYDASIDPEAINAWCKQWPYCEWGWALPDDIVVSMSIAKTVATASRTFTASSGASRKMSRRLPPAPRAAGCISSFGLLSRTRTSPGSAA